MKASPGNLSGKVSALGCRMNQIHGGVAMFQPILTLMKKGLPHVSRFLPESSSKVIGLIGRACDRGGVCVVYGYVSTPPTPPPPPTTTTTAITVEQEKRRKVEKNKQTIMVHANRWDMHCWFRYST